MGATSAILDPGQWPEAVQHLGLVPTIALILALGVGIGLATRAPELIRAVGYVLDVILTKRNESRRIDDLARRNQDVLRHIIAIRREAQSSLRGEDRRRQ